MQHVLLEIGHVLYVKVTFLMYKYEPVGQICFKVSVDSSGSLFTSRAKTDHLDVSCLTFQLLVIHFLFKELLYKSNTTPARAWLY